MRTKEYRKKLMADLKSATKNCIESVEKTHATKNEKKFVGQCYLCSYAEFIIHLRNIVHIIYLRVTKKF